MVTKLVFTLQFSHSSLNGMTNLKRNIEFNDHFLLKKIKKMVDQIETSPKFSDSFGFLTLVLLYTTIFLLTPIRKTIFFFLICKRNKKKQGYESSGAK